MKSKKIGMHIKSDINNINLSKFIHKINIIQLFVNFSIKKNTYEKFSKFLKKHKIECIVHSSYTINLSRDWNEYSWWVKYILHEFEVANILNAKGIVFHVGKKKDLDLNSAINNMLTLITYIDDKTKKYKNIKILIENPAGQGTEIFTNFKELLFFIKQFKSKRIGLCLDSCHIFSVGYDIRKKSVVDDILKDIDKIIGFKKLFLLHLNDSKKDLGERKDRHENIGDGFIGKKELFYLVKKIIKLNIPIILETPFKKHEKEIKLLNNL